MRKILSVISSFCAISTALYAKIKRSKIGAICKKKRCYANLEASLEEVDTYSILISYTVGMSEFNCSV